ncbi:hypothetical protein PUR34_41490 [Streptomyces sp. JV185]|uniref:hypothetical protein n=1 Tax=Streptomyces sp. JV185 TaxID=858638 RepID=UPI002E76FFBC|nr:hypothetical protein [Streptomyces sp. JV185]MEE1774479.1 hypothetical protein [Streptomyces sp. JV185]
MTDQPYTNADIRAEAARQHASLTEDPDFMGVGEAMEDSVVESTDDGTCGRQTWDELLVGPTPNDEYEAYNTAQRKIHDLIKGAASLSEWAVNLGADGLDPEEHSITIGADEKPIARIHFAFEPGMPDEMRTALVEGIGQAIADHM